MQITIYLSDDLIQEIDALAKKQKRSRSSLIQAALTKGLHAEKATEFPVDTLSVFGAWKDFEIKHSDEFRNSFTKDVPRLKLR